MHSLVLRRGLPRELEKVVRLVQEVAAWLRTSKDTDQWAGPWPDRIRHRERILDDLLKGRTWLVWDGETAAATITVDTEGPLDGNQQPVWPEHSRHEPALYIQRVIVSRKYSGCGLGAALLDWAGDLARREYGARLIRIDLWTTNLALHAYYEGQGFARRANRDLGQHADYPSQALFEREADQPGTGYTAMFTELSLEQRL